MFMLCGCPVFPTPFIEEPTYFLIIYSWLHCRKLTIYAQIYFWTIYSVTLKKEMATHSSILGIIPWTEGAWQATVHGAAKSQT